MTERNTETNGRTLSRLEAWIYRHVVIFVAVITFVVTGLTGVIGWLIVDELDQGKKLSGVTRVGPCRSLGIHDAECQRQARLIFAACYLQREECREKFGLVLIRVRREERQTAATGGDALHQPSTTAHQQPGPPSGGHGGGQGHGTPPGTKKPPKPGQPSPPPESPPAPPGTATAGSESAKDQLPDQASPKADPPGLLTPATEHLPEPAQGPVKSVCSALDRATNLC